MMARSPVAGSWQYATCSWLKGDGARRLGHGGDSFGSERQARVSRGFSV